MSFRKMGTRYKAWNFEAGGTSTWSPAPGYAYRIVNDPHRQYVVYLSAPRVGQVGSIATDLPTWEEAADHAHAHWRSAGGR